MLRASSETGGRFVYFYIIWITMWCMFRKVSSYTPKSATTCAIYCNRLTRWLRCDYISISLHQENEMTMKRETTMIKDIIGFSGAIYNTEYAMMCQPMTRIDTPIAVCFLLLLFAVKIRQRLMGMAQITDVDGVENDARECQMSATYCHIFKTLGLELMPTIS